MSEEIVRFSRLLRIFELNDRPAYIIELEKNNKKSLYISYYEINDNIRHFESYKKTELKNKFKKLSKKCLMSQCTSAKGMFDNSIITHFEADCSSLVYGHSMFSFSNLRSIKTEFPLLEDGCFMFSKTKIKELTIDFPKLESGYYMFWLSSIEKISSQFPLLKNGQHMFESTSLKEINYQITKLKYKVGIFDNTPPEFKQNYPYYFV